VIKAIFKERLDRPAAGLQIHRRHTQKRLVGFEVSGHAGYADSGEDIVCAAVTSAVQFSANAITDVVLANAEVIVDENLVGLILSDDPADARTQYGAQAILEALYLHLKDLSEQYRGTIRITVMEEK